MPRCDSRRRSPPPRRRDSREPPPRRADSRRREPAPRRGNSRRRSPPARRSPPRRSPPRQSPARRSPPRRSRSREERRRSPERRCEERQRSPQQHSSGRSKERSPSKEKETEAPKVNRSMGTNDGFESVEGKLVDAKARNDGSPQWQAELVFTLANKTSLGASGRPRSMTIRGPYRTDKDKVKDDVEDLLKASDEGGMKAVRELAGKLKAGRLQ
eukprot:TRINITY_DN111045_c0_g1_i1.p1 TRINITY_DN111045_c0_g1~~TRINITY_DN111045_c0_g1_i1.p1  ORF type:complete len:214 (+),score=16.14 TRINITY_DN111045_c0_g1_i1:16-657(+)